MKRLPCPATFCGEHCFQLKGTEERVLTLRECEAREWDRQGGVSCRRLRHGILHGGTEGTEERVLTLREYEAREWDWRVGVC